MSPTQRVAQVGEAIARRITERGSNPHRIHKATELDDSTLRRRLQRPGKFTVEEIVQLSVVLDTEPAEFFRTGRPS